VKNQPSTLSFHFKEFFRLLAKRIWFKSEPTNISLPKTEFEFLTERPNSEGEALKFGHTPILETLKQIVSASTSCMTIGLFGNWGSGKSSIVESFKRGVLKDEIPVIIFDVWKHEGDALRRTFLRELDKQLSNDPYGENFVKKTNVLNPQVYNSLQLSREQISIKWKRFFYNAFSLVIISFLVLIPIVCIAVLINLVTGINLIAKLSQQTLGTSVGALLTTAFTGGIVFKYIDTFIKVEKKEEKKEKLQDPNEFEQEFHALIDNLKNNITTLVIVFDNLDRIAGDGVLKVISTIKTFLDYNSQNPNRKVIFLIPCDVNAIKVHIHNSLNTEDTQYVDEFLRKFFNASIWIPDFYETELEDFATDKLKATNIPDFQNPRLAWLIIRAFNKNPRQIIQFINTLLAQYLIIKEYCINGQIQEKYFYSTHISQLAKFLLLKIRYPEIMDFYQSNNVYKLDDPEPKKKFGSNDNPNSDFEGFQNLLKITREIEILNLEPFFKFRLSKDEQQIPQLYAILEKIENEVDDLDFIDEVVINSNIQAFSNAIRNRFKAINNEHIKNSFLNGSLIFASKLQIIYHYSLYKDFVDFALERSSQGQLNGIDPMVLAKELIDRFNPIQQNDLEQFINSYIRSISSNYSVIKTLPHNVVAFFTYYGEKFTKKQREEINGFLVNNYKQAGIIDEVLLDKETQRLFITEKFKSTVMLELKKAAPAEILYLLDILDKLLYDKGQVEGIFKLLPQSLSKLVGFLPRNKQVDASNCVLRIIEKNIIKCEEVHLKLLKPLVSMISSNDDISIYLSIIILLNRQKSLKPDVQPLIVIFISRITNEDELKVWLESFNIEELEESTRHILYDRCAIITEVSTVLWHYLNDNEKYDYAKYLTVHGQYEDLKPIFPLILNLSKQKAIDLTNAFIERMPSDIDYMGIENVEWTLNAFLDIQIKNTIAIPQAFFALLPGLLDDLSDEKAFLIGLSVLKKLIFEAIYNQSIVANYVADVMIANNYTTKKEVYEILFHLFHNITIERQNDIRDLIYIHLFHNLSENINNLTVALFVIKSEVEFDLRGCESYFHDFVELAKRYKQSQVSTYYIEISKGLLHVLKPYNTMNYKTVKLELKHIANT
jgi:GTPase SAR1 family protein